MLIKEFDRFDVSAFDDAIASLEDGLQEDRFKSPEFAREQLALLEQERADLVADQV